MDILLQVAIFLPLLGAMIIFFDRNSQRARWTAFTAISSSFLILLYLLYHFSVAQSHKTQFLVESQKIIPYLDIKYISGLDGLSIMLVLLTTFVGMLSVIFSWNMKSKVRGYYAIILVIITSSLGVFTSYDVVIFFIFFETTLLPMFLLINFWSSSIEEKRKKASFIFLIYTLLGSLFLLLGIVYMGLNAGDFYGQIFTSDWRLLASSSYTINIETQHILFFAFMLAFAVKAPLFPFHRWLPYAHTEAPTVGSVILAAVMLKMGTYGIIRFVLPILPDAFDYYAKFVVIASLIGIIYGAFVAMQQTDIKRLVAYSSVSHMGYITMGIFVLNIEALQGSIIQMINHGITTGMLFFLIGIIYNRTHTRHLKDYGGVASITPIYAVFFSIAVFASVGLPGLNGFIGEFLILLGTYKSSLLNNSWYAIIATLGVIFAAIYMLRLLQGFLFGQSRSHIVASAISEINIRERILCVLLVIFIVWIGINSQTFTKYSESSVKNLLEIVEEKKILLKNRTYYKTGHSSMLSIPTSNVNKEK